MLATAEHEVAADQDPALAAERESSRGSRSRATQAFDAPVKIQLKADRQRFDGQRNLFVAEGNVTARINGGLLQADRIEFDSSFNTLRSRQCSLPQRVQYFQAGSLRFSLIQNEGIFEDVYGVLDLDTAALDLDPSNRSERSNRAGDIEPLPTLESSGLGFPTALQIELAGSTAERISPQGDLGGFWSLEQPASSDWVVPGPVHPDSDDHLEMACPPVLPPIPKWHPHPWAATVWGGQSIDSNFGDTFFFNGRMRPEYLLGATLQKRIWKAGPFALEIEGSVLGHQAYQQKGGEFNQSVPFADTPSQTFGEGILGLGARVWLQPWLSLGVVEGVSIFTANSNYERTYRENYAKFLNYLGFELEALVSPQLSLVGRIHHRSGAFGTYSGIRDGSNAYLIGARYRWGKEAASPPQTRMHPPLGCPDPDRGNRVRKKNLHEELEEVAQDRGALQQPSPRVNSTPLAVTEESSLPPAEQERLRTEAIARIDQRIQGIQFQQSLKVEQRQGVPKGINNANVKSDNKFGGIREIASAGRVKLIEGLISRWRIQAAEINITPEGWTADRMDSPTIPSPPPKLALMRKTLLPLKMPTAIS